jgi:hypothetical protein
MREITLSISGKKVVVKPLVGKDVRELASRPKAEDWEILFETLNRAGFKDEELNALPFPDILELNKAVTAETYGIEEEIKN